MSLSIEPEEYDELMALYDTFGVLGAIMREGGTPQALRMSVASLRNAADVLDRIAQRWEPA